MSKQDDKKDDERDEREETSPPPLIFDVEAGIPIRKEHDANQVNGVGITESIIIRPQQNRAPLDVILMTVTEDGLYYDGNDMVKVSPGSTNNQGTSNEDNLIAAGASDVPGCEPMSQTTMSIAAAVPTTLRSSRRLSLPGAFRISRMGAIPPGADDDEQGEPSQADTSVSCGFRTGDADEVLIEAELVCDRSIVAPSHDGQQRGGRDRRLEPLFHSPSDPSEVALVEAKPLHRFCLCCEMLGNWKSICFVILVIVAIAGVAVVVEQNRRISQQQNDQFNQSSVFVLQTTAPSRQAPKPHGTLIPTLTPTTTFSSGAPLEMGDNDTFNEQSELGTIDPTTATTETPATTSSYPPSNGTYSPSSTPSNDDYNLNLPLPPYTLEALGDPTSPQSLAMNWLVQDPNKSDYSADKLKQRFLLATFYFSLDGNNWEEKEYWLSYDKDECQWFSDVPLEVCSDEGRYKTLSLYSDRPNTLIGTLPRELWLLTGLDSIILFTHDVSGFLPDELGGMLQLTDFALRDLSLEGSIPSTVGQMEKLASLELQKNSFDGFIPKEIGNASYLQYLYLDENNLYGFLPSELGLLKDIREIIVHSNALSGSIPSEFGALPKLERLYLGQNMLSGPLSTEMLVGASSSLQFLELGSNFLSGTLPSELGLLANARTIDLYNNKFVGTLVSELGQLHNVSTLLFDSNVNLSGHVPSELGLLTRLSGLWLHNTNLTGFIPKELCDLKRQQDFVLSVDCLKVECNCSCTCGGR